MAALFRRSSRIACQYHRHFSTSSNRTVSLQWERNDPEALKEVLPPYPYGPTRWYKQSRLGLYGGQRIQFGNNVSEKHQTKTRRSWHPNIFTQKLFSKALNRYVQIRVSARVLRTIDKLGGLDEYLLGEKEARIKQLGESGWWLRWAIMQTPSIKKRFAEERRLLGLPEDRDETDAVAEGLASSGEGDITVENSEEVVMDNAFQIEHTKDLPTIKFRVGPGQHVMLTPDGWRRTRPSSTYFINKRKETAFWDAHPEYVGKQMEIFKAEVEQRQLTDDDTWPLAETANKNLIVSTRRRLNKELREKIDKMYEQRVAAKDERKALRKSMKSERKIAKDSLANSAEPEYAL